MEKKTYDLAFSLGYSCGASQALRDAGLQFASLPMDWTGTSGLDRCAEVVASDFAHWLDRDALELVDVRRGPGLSTRIYRNRVTGIGFIHEFSDFMPFSESYPKVVEMYDRRIARLKELLAASKRVLMVYLELPFRKPIPESEIRKARDMIAAKYPNATFDFLYVHEDPAAAAARVEWERDGISSVALDYRLFDRGEVTHFVRTDALARFLRDNVSVRDYRTEAEKRRFAALKSADSLRRWGQTSKIRCYINRWSFRVFRHLEKYLMARGLVMREGPLWFVDRKLEESL